LLHTAEGIVKIPYKFEEGGQYYFVNERNYWVSVSFVVSLSDDLSISELVPEVEASLTNLSSLLLINAYAINSKRSTQNMVLTIRKIFIVN
jgi:hypothetical protein